MMLITPKTIYSMSSKENSINNLRDNEHSVVHLGEPNQKPLQFQFCFFFLLKFYLFLVVLGLCCCMQATLQFQYTGFPLRWLLQLRSMGSTAWVQQSWHTGLVASSHVGSSWTRDCTCVPCIGRWILNHWITRGLLPAVLNTSYQ